jgi:hypothetical protein
MSVYKKLQEARMKLQNTALKKSGHNKFAGYYYFELGDFLPAIQKICSEMGLCGVVSFDHNMAFLQINDTEDGTSVMFTSPMSSAALKGCHDVQNLGAVQTYLRRYLWVNAFEIVEHDALDATLGSDTPKKHEAVVARLAPKEATIAVKPTPTKPAVKAALPGEWTLKPIGDDFTESLKVGLDAMLQLATSPDDVANIFKVNRSSFDKAKEMSPEAYAEMMAKFTATKNLLLEE